MLAGAKGCAGQSVQCHASWDSSLVLSQLSPGARVLPPGSTALLCPCHCRVCRGSCSSHSLAAAGSEPRAPGALTRTRFPRRGRGLPCTAGVRCSPCPGCCQWVQLEPSEGPGGGQQLPPLCPCSCGPAPPSEAVNFRFHCGFCFLSCVMVSGAGPVCVIPAFGPFVMLHTAI